MYHYYTIISRRRHGRHVLSRFSKIGRCVTVAMEYQYLGRTLYNTTFEAFSFIIIIELCNYYYHLLLFHLLIKMEICFGHGIFFLKQKVILHIYMVARGCQGKSS